MMSFESELRLDGELVVVALRGELDIATCPLAEEEILRAEALNAAALIVDLSELEFMDSTGAKLLVDAQDRALAAGRRMAVFNASGAPHRVIELLGLQDFLHMIDDPSELGRPDHVDRRGRAR